MLLKRSYPVGAELVEGGAHFRVWAPAAKQIKLIIYNNTSSSGLQSMNLSPEASREIMMNSEPHGYSACFVPDAEPGALYQFQLDDDETLYPDPASRYQPLGPHGPSRLEPKMQFAWSDAHWQGADSDNVVIYEMHVGTFTQEGNYLAAARELPELAALGITIIELMPVNEFDGNFGWGYDGVGLYAPYHGYGEPDDLRYFIDRAHALGIAVILDVVYNHVGSSGCYLHKFSADYFSKKYPTEWGDVFNFDGKNNEPVRDFIIQNAIYWIRDFHFDGFRLDATQQIWDASELHIIAALVNAAREVAGTKNLYIVGENEPQQRKLVAPVERGGYGLDSLWNDDFHHVARVAMTGRTGAYFTDYKGEAQEFIASVKYGFIFQGQWYKWQRQRRGTASLKLPATAFVHYLQSHDQVANGGRGQRIHELAHPALLRALTALLLLAPQTPMLFQGQEFAASSPFLYFADNGEHLVDVVAQGRNEFLYQFPHLATPAMQPYLYRPEDRTAFKKSKLDFAEREAHAHVYCLHKELLQLRKSDPVLSRGSLSHVDGAAISSSIFVLRFFSKIDNDDRLLIINMGRDLTLSPVPEPLLAPHEGYDWALRWSSEFPQYSGHGACEISTKEDWLMPGMSAALLLPVLLTPHETDARVES